ncbi:MAG: RIP metalloprotease RseP [Parasporobacterium sp.]|nr:RIP metalloprotease RseP [Parasporobacterium sp.]
MSFISIIIAIIILGILIIVHEFGHFIVARKNGIFVKEFSVGFGPRIISHTCKSGMLLSWKAIPFGGSCQMLGALEDEDAGTDDERSYDSKSVWARMSVTLAGPVFNFLLAFVLSVIVIGTMGYDPPVVTQVLEDSPAYEAGLREGDLITSFDREKINFGKELYLHNYLNPLSDKTELVEISFVRDQESHTIRVAPYEYQYYSVGISYYSNGEAAKIAEVTQDSPVEQAGLKEGDVITRINDTEIATGEDLETYFSEHPVTQEPLRIEYLRHGGTFETTVYPAVSSAYRVGFTYNTANVKASVGDVLKYSFAEMKYEILSVFKSLGLLFSSRGSLDMLSGPVGIVEVVGTTYDASVSSGFLVTVMNLLGIMIMLSANLGVLNLLPIPALDGGKFILLVIEAIIRKQVPKKVEGIVTMIGAGLLFLLMIVVLVNDVTKFF